MSQNQENTLANESQIRMSEYRSLLTKVEEIEEENSLGLNTIDELGEVLHKIKNLDSQTDIEQKVQFSEEIFLDCLVLSSTSNILKKCVKAVDVFTTTYDNRLFAERINSKIHVVGENSKPLNILNLLKDAREIIPNVPKLSCLYGAFEFDKAPEVKQRKERVKHQKEQLQKKAPEHVVTLDKEEQNIETIVTLFYNVLKEEYQKNEEEPISYYDFVIDTDDFATTVENIFYTSFLIRNGKAKMNLDNSGNPTIEPVGKSAAKNFRNKGGVNSQIITSISVANWQKFKKPGFLQKNKELMEN